MQLSKTCRRQRRRPLFGKQGAQRLIHIRQLLGSCTEPSAAPSPSAGRISVRLGGSPRVPSSLVWSRT